MLESNVGEHISDPANSADKELILSSKNTPESAPAFEIVIKWRCDEKRSSSMAPYNSPEGTVYVRKQVKAMCVSDADAQAVWDKYAPLYKKN